MKILVCILVVLSLGVLPGCGEGEEGFGRREEGWGFEAEDYDAGRILLEPYGSLFYALIRSRRDPSNDPLVIWLNGGPGSSSMFGLLMENGPWKLVNDGDLERNEYSWNNIANMLYVDQPFGTGFSTVSSSEYLVKNENEAAVYFHRFLVSFIEKFPEYKHRPLYLTGESYAGRYIPAISNEIIKQNYSTINLVG